MLTLLEVIGSIAICATYLDKNALFGQLICHMQQFPETAELGSVSACASRYIRVDLTFFADAVNQTGGEFETIRGAKQIRLRVLCASG